MEWCLAGRALLNGSWQVCCLPAKVARRNIRLTRCPPAGRQRRLVTRRRIMHPEEVAVDWAEGFYSATGRWWGPAESGITQRDHDRVALVRALCGPEAVTMLELGCGYGNTAAAAARDGFRVTGVDISSTRLEFAHRHAEPGDLGSPRFVRPAGLGELGGGYLAPGAQAGRRVLVRAHRSHRLRPRGLPVHRHLVGT